MRDVHIIRVSTSDEGTLGKCFVDEKLFSDSLELPWRDNKPSISCIPSGIYTAVWSMSKRFGKETYNLIDVPGRSGIRIHGGVWSGDKWKKFKCDSEVCIFLGIPCIRNSQTALRDSIDIVDKFNTMMKKETFRMHIMQLY